MNSKNILNNNYRESKTAEDIYPIVDEISKAFELKDYNFVDDFLLNIDFKKHNELSLLTIIRTTYPAKNKLNNWIELRNKIALKIKDSNKKLRGLY